MFILSLSDNCDKFVIIFVFIFRNVFFFVDVWKVFLLNKERDM